MAIAINVLHECAPSNKMCSNDKVRLYVAVNIVAKALYALYIINKTEHFICDRPQENRPSSHLVLIVEIPVLKVLISITSFCSC